MKKNVIILTAIFFAVSACFAADAELPATWDTKVSEAESTTNYGDAANFSIWGGSVSTPPEKVLLYFQGVDELLAAGSICDYAELRLYVNYLVAPGDAGIYKAADAWDEGAVNWDNRPGEDRDMEIIQGLPSSADTWFNVDVTGIVQSWMNDGAPHNGFYVDISGDHPAGAGCQFPSSESSDPDLTPRMFVEYHPGVGVEHSIEPQPSLEISAVSTARSDVSFCITSSGFVSLKVYDAAGTLMKTIFEGTATVGNHHFILDSQPGVYFVKMSFEDQVICKKAVVLD